MYLAQLAEKLLANPQHRVLRYEWPEKIWLPGESIGGIFGFRSRNKFWQRISELRKFTDVDVDKFSEKHVGSTGWEYELMLVYVNGKFYYSNPTTSKNYMQVSSHHQFNVELVDDRDKQTVTDKIHIDGEYVGSEVFTGNDKIRERNERINKGEYKAGFLMHFHTHPQQQVAGTKKKYYSFFSPEDIASFIGSSTPIMGLVTDRLWLLGKTEEFMGMVHRKELENFGKDLIQVSHAELKSEEELLEAAGNFFSKYELVGYECGFGGTPGRVS